MWIACAVEMVACGHIDEETPRSFVSRVISDTAEQRQEMASELLAGRKVHLAGPLILKERNGITPAKLDFGWISTTGTVVAHRKSLAVVLVLEPILSSSTVQWNCVVYPVDARPNVC